jgi:hypothetical protein
MYKLEKVNILFAKFSALSLRNQSRTLCVDHTRMYFYYHKQEEQTTVIVDPFFWGWRPALADQSVSAAWKKKVK